MDRGSPLCTFARSSGLRSTSLDLSPISWSFATPQDSGPNLQTSSYLSGRLNRPLRYPSPSSGVGYSLGLGPIPSGSKYLYMVLVHLLLSHSVCICKCQTYIE